MSAESSPREVDRRVGLPAGTRVQKRSPGPLRRFGTVMPYESEYSRGCFPVRFDDWIWEKCDLSDVVVVARSDVAPVEPRPAPVGLPPTLPLPAAGRPPARRAAAPRTPRRAVSK